jgi:cobalt-zinc-cadmium efflux system protein
MVSQSKQTLPGKSSGYRLLFATVFNFVIALAEVIGGFMSGSLSLVSDALHNLSDGIALFIAFLAGQVGKRPSNERKTFGYKRIEILAAFFNSILLSVISIYLFYEAFRRILNPVPIKGMIMFIIAGVGLAANLSAMLLLRKDAGANINIKSAYLHLLSDTLSSVAVIIGGIIIYIYRIYWIDPIITILIGLYVLRETWKILRQTIDILMQSTPVHLDLMEIRTDLENLPSVENIHHVHAWNLDDRSIQFECHIELSKDINISEAENVHEKIKEILNDRYGINHITIQFEHGWCHDQDIIQH